MRKTIGNILFIIAGVSAVLLILSSSLGWDVNLALFGIPYGLGLLGGIILRIGDFFKWRAKKHQEGIEEAKAKYTRFCPHCGKGLAAETAFCPHCGQKL